MKEAKRYKSKIAILLILCALSTFAKAKINIGKEDTLSSTPHREWLLPAIGG